jgi:hypothetical protein
VKPDLGVDLSAFAGVITGVRSRTRDVGGKDRRAVKLRGDERITLHSSDELLISSLLFLTDLRFTSDAA